MTRTATQPTTDVIDLTNRSIAWATPESLFEALEAFDDMIELIEGANVGGNLAIA